ncbi:MAG: hypothetical protein OYM47_20825 [Gemmatimonadota bacterium]|nr:hypothetical protein [Gemmatimonadota bacterium]
MTGIYALYRLLWRPLILAFYLIFAGLIVGLLWAAGTKLPGLSEPGRLILITMALPSIAGIFVGQSVGEIQHTPLSWLLPRLRRLLFSSVCITGIGLAALITWTYHSMGGFAPAIPTLASCFLWYSLAFAIGTYEFVDARTLRYRGSVLLYITILILGLGVLSFNRITDYFISQPVLCTLVTLLVAILYLKRTSDVEVTRDRSLVSMPVFHRYTFGPHQTARMTARRDSRRRWNRAAPLTGLVDWIRAGEYENYGTVRIGWLGSAFLYSTVILSIVAVLIQLFGQAEAVIVPITLGLWMLQLSLYVKTGWLYPLSRLELARLTFWCSLLHNALHCGIMLLTFLLLDGLTGIFAGLDLARPLVLMFICNPVIQWVRFRNQQFKVSSYVILAVFIIGYSIMIAIWLESGPSISFSYEAATVASLILLSQALFRYKVNRYFKTGDLV